MYPTHKTVQTLPVYFIEHSNSKKSPNSYMYYHDWAKIKPDIGVPEMKFDDFEYSVSGFLSIL